MSPSMKYSKIVVLTGAGTSAESGLSTFRGADGLWENHRVEDVATPAAFERDPQLVQRFYNLRRQQLTSGTIEPNAAHLALAKFEADFNVGPQVSNSTSTPTTTSTLTTHSTSSHQKFLLVTQNIDDLHERAGSQSLLHIHGELLKQRCQSCHQQSEIRGDIELPNECPRCSRMNQLRPDIVWFGEMPMFLDEISDALAACDLFVAIGTSGNVYPAAGFVEIANSYGAHTVEINLESSAVGSSFQQRIYGNATETVPAFFLDLLRS